MLICTYERRSWCLCIGSVNADAYLLLVCTHVRMNWLRCNKKVLHLSPKPAVIRRNNITKPAGELRVYPCRRPPLRSTARKAPAIRRRHLRRRRHPRTKPLHHVWHEQVVELKLCTTRETHCLTVVILCSSCVRAFVHPGAPVRWCAAIAFVNDTSHFVFEPCYASLTVFACTGYS